MHFVIHLVLFWFVSWIILTPLGFYPASVIAAGFLISILTILMEWLVASSLIISLLKPRWIKPGDEPVLSEIMYKEASKAEVNLVRIGVLDTETPNAIVLETSGGSLIILLTKGLIYTLTTYEIRTIATWAMGAFNSGFLGVTTMYSGLLSLSHRLSYRYIEGRIRGGKDNIAEKVLAALGYIPFILNVSQLVKTSRLMSDIADETVISNIGNPTNFLTTIIKVVRGSSIFPKGENRTLFSPVKGLMFIDPTQAIRDTSKFNTAINSMGIEITAPLEHNFIESGSNGIEYHIFEWYFSQLSPLERFRRGIALCKEVKAPIKIGFKWIE